MDGYGSDLEAMLGATHVRDPPFGPARRPTTRSPATRPAPSVEGRRRSSALEAPPDATSSTLDEVGSADATSATLGEVAGGRHLGDARRRRPRRRAVEFEAPGGSRRPARRRPSSGASRGGAARRPRPRRAPPPRTRGGRAPRGGARRAARAHAAADLEAERGRGRRAGAPAAAARFARVRALHLVRMDYGDIGTCTRPPPPSGMS